MFYRMYYVFLIYGSVSLIVAGDLGSDIRRTFAKQFLNTFGNGAQITVDNVTKVYTQHSFQWPTQSTLESCFNKKGNGMDTIKESCLLEKCLSPADVYQLSGLSEGTTTLNVSTLTMILLHTLKSKTCYDEQPPTALKHSQVDHHDELHEYVPVTKAETWGFGILCTTIIVLAALGGLLALPFAHGANYQRLLIYMVGLAVGTLAGSSILFLMPEALDLHEEDLGANNPLWKSLVVIGAIYIFFLVERILKMITHWRESHKRHKELHDEIQGGRFAKLKPEARLRDPRFTDLNTISQIPISTENVSKDSGLDTVSGHETVNDSNTQVNSVSSNTDIEGGNDVKRVAPVAWMIIFGDALHNFVDGVSIGATFTDSVLGGVSVSVAVFCEELPHELGDFAVLLNAGMSTKRAAICNFLSACTIYIGLIVGVFLGENMAANTWIYAFAAGMFLYIALVDMMPEMYAAGEKEVNKKLVGTGYIFLLQNLGILSGFGIMLILAIYGGHLQLAITGEE
ncbi:metal cation symporter ZIP8-like isoform X2 [Mercenaria mercenaria]|uniref:metal cation symporter ZIP8-like isoform X2 n=1 Tax=Mercenaria mercenaria TaxID=6596 RepID=UPI00234E3844|nr:metal cation symporter ZIP8-like isoform X2 [Mercenaria mercenaria]